MNQRPPTLWDRIKNIPIIDVVLLLVLIALAVSFLTLMDCSQDNIRDGVREVVGP